MRRHLSDWLRSLWRGIPIPMERKLRAKQALFTGLPWAFARTRAYRDWAMATGARVQSPSRAPRRVRAAAPISPTDHVPLLQANPPGSLPVRLIAFYLPQFHTIPENDAWWGEGFTEWTKVKPSLPLFEGHEQPHVPLELGYYRLGDSEVPRRQIELARRYGVAGFCFYYYWFAGKTLLERPVEHYLQDTTLDLPFCLCWANENWSRRWDGLDQELLISQRHSAEDDLAFIEHVARFLRDPRYLRIDGRPVLLLYRPSLLPDIRETVQRWRRWCRDHGVGEIYLAYPQSFDAVDPAHFGFDAAIEFPPNNSGPPNITDQVKPVEGHNAPMVYDWQVFVERSKHYINPSYTLLRSVCPAWDNTARKGSRGAVFLGSNPKDYQTWLANAVAETCRVRSNPDERLVFVNAWNEWAEGAHLEPDLRHGHAYLQATRNALTGETFVPDDVQRVVLVSHDAHPHGAQFLALNLARTLVGSMRCEVHLVCLGAGPLKPAFAEAAHRLYDLEGMDPRGPKALELARMLHSIGARIAIANTTVSGLFVETLAQTGIRSVALIHELRGVLEQYSLQAHAKSIVKHASHIICPAAAVAASFTEFSGEDSDRIVVRPQGIYKRADRSLSREQRRAQVRELLGIGSDTLIVLGVGYADERKGVDLFVQAAFSSLVRDPDCHWVWIGHWDQQMRPRIEQLIATHPELGNRIHFPGIQPDTTPFYLGADAFALTSREDPFPSVILEAFDADLPVVAFHDAGGFTELTDRGVLELVPHSDAVALAKAVDALTRPSEARDAMTRAARALVDTDYSFRAYVRFLLETLGVTWPKVSVIVPNYNYARYMDARLGSILDQTAPLHELIFLDDCSTDDSIEVASRLLDKADVDWRIVHNETNSGSVFSQWQKGVELASGDVVWIAEADDESEPEFLRTVLRGFQIPGMVMSYCESQSIDASGNRRAADYSAYVATVDSRHWRNHFASEGTEEVRRYLSVMNTIPNVSAVLFERGRLREVMDHAFEDIRSFRVAGDWRLYVEVLRKGGVSFSPATLNRHRRHQGGVTLGERRAQLIEEIRTMQQFVSMHFSVPPEMAERARAYLDTLSLSQDA